MKINALILLILLSIMISPMSCGSDTKPLTIPSETISYASPADISVTNLIVTPLIAQSNERVTVTAEITNAGGTSGSYLVIMKLNGEPKAQSEVKVNANSTEYKSFYLTGGKGNYTVSIGEVSVDYVVLEHENTASPPIRAPTTSVQIPNQPNCDHYYQTYLSYQAEAENYQDLARQYLDLAQEAQDEAAGWIDAGFFEMAEACLESADNFYQSSQREADRASHAHDQANEYYNLYQDCLQGN